MFLGPYLEAGLHQFSVTLRTVRGRGTMSTKHPPAWPSLLSHTRLGMHHICSLLSVMPTTISPLSQRLHPLPHLKALAISLLHTLMRGLLQRHLLEGLCIPLHHN